MNQITGTTIIPTLLSVVIVGLIAFEFQQHESIVNKIFDQISQNRIIVVFLILVLFIMPTCFSWISGVFFDPQYIATYVLELLLSLLFVATSAITWRILSKSDPILIRFKSFIKGISLIQGKKATYPFNSAVAKHLLRRQWEAKPKVSTQEQAGPRIYDAPSAPYLPLAQTVAAQNGVMQARGAALMSDLKQESMRQGGKIYDVSQSLDTGGGGSDSEGLTREFGGPS